MVEAADTKHWIYAPPKSPTLGEDSDNKVLLVAIAEASHPTELNGEVMHIEADDGFFDDGLEDVPALERESRDVVANLLDEVEPLAKMVTEIFDMD